MSRVMSSDISKHVGERILVAGWVQQVRVLSQVAFIVLRDSAGTAQIVVEDESTREFVAALNFESVVEIEADVVASPQAPGGHELHRPVVRVIGTAVEPTPFELRRPVLNAQLPVLLDNAALSLRHPRIRAGASISAASMAGFRSTLDGLGFTEIQTPKIVGGATESGANVFSVDYFGRPAFLAQSPQLYKQMMVGVFERVYETGPVFRAEPHDTVRHLAEYVSLDVELGFISDHRDVERVLREVLVGMVEAVRSRADQAVKLLDLQLPVVPEAIPSVHFADAQKMIEEATGEPTIGEPDLSPANERWLSEWALQQFNSEFLFVEGYPMVKRPFYTQPDPVRPEFSNSFDLLFRGLELVTGGQRLNEFGDYVSRLDEDSAKVLEGYLAAFRHGMPPHGGFAIGLERWTARLTGAANVRQVTLFPRDINRLTP